MPQLVGGRAACLYRQAVAVVAAGGQFFVNFGIKKFTVKSTQKKNFDV
jgi:hypothetical protein